VRIAKTRLTIDNDGTVEGTPMSANKKAWTAKQLSLLSKLHGKMGSTNINESEAARRHILKMLIDHGNSWNDMMGLLQQAQAQQYTTSTSAPTSPPPSGATASALELYQTIRAFYEEHITFDPDPYVICPLWAMHSHIFRRFMHTPRLLFKSAFRGHGKSRALRVTETFTANAIRSENATAAVFFRWTDEGYNVLLDEIDNLELMSDRNFRAALNSGYDRDGTFDRYIQGGTRFKTFAAVALAGIGAVPLPLARRSIPIIMKFDPNADRTRRLFNRDDPALDNSLDVIGMHLAAWASDPKLNIEPLMPELLTGGQCDLWRPLISIADACSTEVGEHIREIAVRMCRGFDQDPEVVLLRDIQLIFNERRADRLLDKVILADLRMQPHGWWSDWRGRNGTDPPRELTYGIMAKMLWDGFQIRARTIRFDKGPKDTGRGLLREQFAKAWADYCGEEADTPSQSSNIKHLR
jgi:hypothetical protein